MPKCDRCGESGWFLKLLTCEDCDIEFCINCGDNFVPNKIIDEIREYNGKTPLSDDLPPSSTRTVGDILFSSTQMSIERTREIRKDIAVLEKYTKGRKYLCKGCFSKARNSILRKHAQSLWDKKKYKKTITFLEDFNLEKTAKKQHEKGIKKAKRLEKLLKFKMAANLYEDLGLDDESIRCRQEIVSELRPKIDIKTEKVSLGDDKSITIKDSVVHRSKIQTTSKKRKKSKFCRHCGESGPGKYCPQCGKSQK